MTSITFFQETNNCLGAISLQPASDVMCRAPIVHVVCLHQISRHAGMYRQYGNNVTNVEITYELVRTTQDAMLLRKGNQLRAGNNASPIIAVVLRCQPEKRAVAGTGDVFLGKMVSTSVNDCFVPVTVDINHRAFHSHRDIIPLTRTDKHLGDIIKNKVTRTNFTRHPETVCQRTGRRIPQRNLKLGITVDVPLLDVFQHTEIIPVNLQDLFLGTGMISMPGMGQKPLKLDVHVRSNDIDNAVNLLIDNIESDGASVPREIGQIHRFYPMQDFMKEKESLIDTLEKAEKVEKK